jgi:hypothetical protein
MTVDERIEKLAERHEALAQTVELLTIDLRKTESIATELTKSMMVLRESVLDLVGVVRSHEHRIARIEGQ